MRIREIHVHGFGALSDLHLEGLSPRMNVVVGPNEAGKTTLRDFIRAVLFGFGHGAAKREPLREGRHGGRLHVSVPPCAVVPRGGDLVLEVEAGKPAAGVRTGRLADGTILSSEELTELVGVSRHYFKNVHAFGIEELQKLETLTEEGMADYLFGAFTATDPRRLAEARKTIDERMRALLPPRSPGRVGELLDELETARESISRLLRVAEGASAIEHQRRDLGEEIAGLSSEIARLRAERAGIDRALALRPRRDELRAIEERLAAIRAPEKFPPDAKERVDRLQRALADARAARQRAGDALRRAEEARDAARPDPTILALTGDIEALSARRPRFEMLGERQRDLQHELSALERELERRRSRLGRGWTDEEIVRARDLDAIDGETEALALRRHLAATRRAAIDPSPGAGAGRAIQSIGPWAAVAIGISLAIVSAVAETPHWWGVGAGALLSGVGAVWAIGSARRARRVASADAELSRAEDDWSSHLRAIGLDPTFSTERAREALRELRALPDLVVSRVERARQLAGTEREMAAFEEEIRRLVASRPEMGRIGNAGGDEAGKASGYATLTALGVALSRARSAEHAAAGWEAEVEARRHEVAQAEDNLAAAEKALDLLYREVGATDAASFDHLAAAASERAQLLADRARLQRELDREREALGSPDLDFARFENQAAELDARLKELREHLADRNQRLGAAGARIDDLRADRELAKLRLNEERLLAEIATCAEEWSIVSLARALLEEAKLRFEREHQPAVLRTAGDLLARMTGGAFRQVLRPLEGSAGAIVCVRENGEHLYPAQLSRGTREELFLAIRFAALMESRSSRTPLPVVMDDILVNFDESRARRTAEIMRELSESHQILYFTCHPQIAEMIHDAATDVTSFALPPPTARTDDQSSFSPPSGTTAGAPGGAEVLPPA